MPERSPYVLRTGVTTTGILRSQAKRRRVSLPIAAYKMPRLQVTAVREPFGVTELANTMCYDAFELVGLVIRRHHAQSAHQLKRRVSLAQPAGRWASLEKIEQTVHGPFSSEIDRAASKTWERVWLVLNNSFAELRNQWDVAICTDFLKGSQLV